MVHVGFNHLIFKCIARCNEKLDTAGHHDETTELYFKRGTYLTGVSTS